MNLNFDILYSINLVITDDYVYFYNISQGLFLLNIRKDTEPLSGIHVRVKAPKHVMMTPADDPVLYGPISHCSKLYVECGVDIKVN